MLCDYHLYGSCFRDYRKQISNCLIKKLPVSARTLLVGQQELKGIWRVKTLLCQSQMFCFGEPVLI